MIIRVRVKPNSKKQEIKKINNNYIINLKSKPENNKANIELIKLLSKELKLPSKNIKIIKGMKSKDKIVEVKYKSFQKRFKSKTQK